MSSIIHNNIFEGKLSEIKEAIFKPKANNKKRDIVNKRIVKINRILKGLSY